MRIARLSFTALLPLLCGTLLAAPASAQTPTADPVTLPPGVRSLIAHQGDNTIIADATPEGYARVRALVRRLDGDLDIIRTDVVLVAASPAALQAAGLAADATDAALLAAFRAGHLPATDHVRLTTREDTPIGTQLRDLRGDALPLSVVPREDGAGGLSVEILQPAARHVSDAEGTTVAHLPNEADGTLRLLFLTPALLPAPQR